MQNNREFIEFVLDHKKVQYDPSFFDGLAKQYFILTIQEVEQAVDLTYMRSTAEFTLGQGQYIYQFPQSVHIKNIKHLVDKKRRVKLFPFVFDIETALTFPEGVPSTFWFDEGIIYFDRKAVEDIEYIVTYYKYTYNDPNLTSLEALHPLVKNYFNLILYRYLAYIDHFYHDSQSMALNLQLFSTELTKTKRNEFTKSGRYGNIYFKL